MNLNPSTQRYLFEHKEIFNQLHKLYNFHGSTESFTGEELNFVSLEKLTIITYDI